MNAMWGVCFICLVCKTKQNKEQCGFVFPIPRYSFQLQYSLGFTMMTAVGALAMRTVGKAVRWVILYVPIPDSPQEKFMAVLKTHICVCCADALLSSGSLCWDPWFWILYNHFSTGLVSRTVLLYSCRKKLDLSFHWIFWRVSCLHMYSGIYYFFLHVQWVLFYNLPAIFSSHIPSSMESSEFVLRNNFALSTVLSLSLALINNRKFCLSSLDFLNKLNHTNFVKSYSWTCS